MNLARPARTAAAFRRGCVVVVLSTFAHGHAQAQGLATRLAILQAEARGAVSAGDLMAIKRGVRDSDIETVRLAIRVLGGLERPVQIPELLLSLRHSLPEVRVEAGNAVAQAAQGFRTARPATIAVTIRSVQDALVARLEAEENANVRAALCEAVARLPYTGAADILRAEQAIVAIAARMGTTNTMDRLGVAKSLEALARIHRSIRPAGPQAVEILKTFIRQAGMRSAQELLRDARVRRLAIEGLTSAAALDDEVIGVGAGDPDAQVRRLAMRAAAISGLGMAKVRDGVFDPVALVRVEALRALRSRGDERTCSASLAATADQDTSVALVAIDQLGTCGQSPESIATLEGFVLDRAALEKPRGWHRSAHALVALASAAPDRATALLASHVRSPIWQVRTYAARAAAMLAAHDALQTLGADSDDRVAGVALVALGAPERTPAPAREPALSAPTAADLRRLASPRATITIRDLGRVELALVTAEAPATVLRFVQLAESGYYNGLTFDRIAPNAIVQAGRRMTDPARYSQAEVGTWPQVRGAVVLSTPDTNDAQFFVNLVDNPRFDHQYTVFAQVLNGTDLLDQILEGDVIESIAITP